MQDPYLVSPAIHRKPDANYPLKGEDALANICIERQPSGQISGHLRIRSKTQGIALSLGDKIALFQRNLASEQSAANVPELFQQLMLGQPTGITA